MITPEQFTSSCNKLISLVNAQAKLSTQAELGNDTTVNELCTAGRQLSDDMLRVLVMGIFNAGKSSFLNALMGQYLLPTKPIPATAIIGEVVYADKPSATLYPKKTGSKPIDVKIEELDKYILIDHEAASKDEVQKPNPYVKMTLKYPLNSCKNGVMFIDSPGLNDPTCHDAITQEYLPQADAIIYCMNGSVAFTAFDKNEIERLRAMGYRSIIFVLTYMDVLENNDNLMGTHQADDARMHYTKILSQYTDLGASGIFFVSSLQALMGKKKQDARLLEASHFPPFEKRLEEILFNEKGRMKLLKPLYTAAGPTASPGSNCLTLSTWPTLTVISCPGVSRRRRTTCAWPKRRHRKSTSRFALVPTRWSKVEKTSARFSSSTKSFRTWRNG